MDWSTAISHLKAELGIQSGNRAFEKPVMDGINQTDSICIWNSRSYSAFHQLALNLPPISVQPQGDDCSHCPHAVLNLKVFHALHLLKWRNAIIDAAMWSGCTYGVLE